MPIDEQYSARLGDLEAKQFAVYKNTTYAFLTFTLGALLLSSQVAISPAQGIVPSLQTCLLVVSWVSLTFSALMGLLRIEINARGSANSADVQIGMFFVDTRRLRLRHNEARLDALTGHHFMVGASTGDPALRAELEKEITKMRDELRQATQEAALDFSEGVSKMVAQQAGFDKKERRLRRLHGIAEWSQYASLVIGVSALILCKAAQINGWQ